MTLEKGRTWNSYSLAFTLQTDVIRPSRGQPEWRFYLGFGYVVDGCYPSLSGEIEHMWGRINASIYIETYLGQNSPPCQNP